jgi:spermidine synthase
MREAPGERYVKEPTRKAWTAPAAAAIWAAAGCSGAASLAYEICWSRGLVVPLGNSTDAAAVVLGGFMLGIAAGARWGGAVAERVRSPLRVYAGVELGLAGYAVVAPALLAKLGSIGAAASDGVSGSAGWVVRSLLALLLIVVPSLGMGATLPLLVRTLTRHFGVLRTQISVAYGANTVGAAVGAAATGFWGIASLGLWQCSVVAAAVSATAAGLAVLADGRIDSRREPRRPADASHHSTQLQRLALLGAFVAGCAMLACELVWARVLTFVFGHDTYAFASLLSIVLLGIGLGGLVHRVLARCDQIRLLAVLLAGFAFAVLASFWAAATVVVEAGRDPFGLDASGALATSVWLELYRELLYAPVLVLLPSVLSGIVFPAACSAFGSGAEDAGRKVGVVFLVNGVGSTLGALVAAFGLVSWVGIQGAFFVIALVCAAAAGALVLARTPHVALRSQIAALAPLAVVVVLAATMPRGLPRLMLLRAVGARHQTLLHYEEARTGTVSVIVNQINGEKQLLINAVNEVTTRLVHDQSFKVLGHLGPLLHPAPQRAVMICLGAGMSAGAALTHPMERLDVVDLSPAVERGARYWKTENNGVLDHPAFRLHIDDGRQFLLNSAVEYDVAIVDSTHPKAVDSWILYTREFYDLLRSRLAPGGIAVQWLPLHGLSENEFKIVVATFNAAFPQTTLWANAGFETYGQVAYAKLVGSKGGPLIIDYARLAARLAEPRVRDDLTPYGLATPEQILGLFLSGPDGVARWTEGLPVQTDDHPLVAYTTGYSRGRRMAPRLLLGVRQPVEPFLRGRGRHIAEVRNRVYAAAEAQGMVLAGRLDRAVALHPEATALPLFVAQQRTTRPYYLALANRYPDDPEKLFEAGTQLGTLGSPDEAQPILERALELQPGDFRIRLNLALLLRGGGQTDRALEILSELHAEYPTSAVVLHNLGVAALSAGEPGVAAAHLQQALAWDPDRLGARLELARSYLAARDLARAKAQLSTLLDLNPWVADAHFLLGLLSEQRRDHDRSVACFRRATELEPYEPSYQFHLGQAYQQQDRLDPAERAFRTAIEIDPKQASARTGLGMILARRGLLDAASDQFVAALEADPTQASAAENLGLVLSRLRRNEEAVGALCLALELDPKSATARRELRGLGQSPELCE